MARVEISDDVLAVRPFNKSVRAIEGAEVQVNVRDGGAATVYAAASGGTTLTNPLTTDAAGRIEGWLEPGSYDLVVTYDNGAEEVTYTRRYEATSGSAESGGGSGSGTGIDEGDVGYDVILLAGQSNMSGRAEDWDALHFDPPTDRIWQWGATGTYANKLSIAVEPLIHPDFGADSNQGPGLIFARWLATITPSNRRILLVPAAVGQTGFSTGSSPDNWDPAGSGNLYTDAIGLCNAAIAAAGANARLRAILWHQGEADTGMSQAAYAAKLDALIAGFRAGITGASDSTPFLVGRLSANYNASNPTAAHLDTPSRVENTAVTEQPSSTRGDNIHFDQTGQQQLGRYYFDAYLTLANGPDAPTDLIATAAGDNSVDLSWTAPADDGDSPITDYTVQYALTGSGAWTTFTDGVSTDTEATVTGLDPGTTYDFRVAAVNDSSSSPYSGEDSATTTGEAPFSQTTVAGMKFWYKANAITGKVDGDTLTTWADSSTNGRNLTAAGAAILYKTNQVNGLPAVRFGSGGASAFGSTSGSTIAQPVTVFIVAKPTASGSHAAILGNDNTSTIAVYKDTSNRLEPYAGSLVSGGASIAGAFHVLSVVFNGASTVGRMDGASQVAANPGAAGIGASVALGAADAGPGGFPYTGDIAEVIIYQGALSSGDQLTVREYLGEKYGITVT